METSFILDALDAAHIDAQLHGHLTTEQLEAELGRVHRQLIGASRPRAVLLDCSAMTGYDLAARAVFVEWNRAHRDEISALAIVVVKPLWFAVIASMALASRQTMKAFRHREDARTWLGLRAVAS